MIFLKHTFNKLKSFFENELFLIRSCTTWRPELRTTRTVWRMLQTLARTSRPSSRLSPTQTKLSRFYSQTTWRPSLTNKWRNSRKGDPSTTRSRTVSRQLTTSMERSRSTSGCWWNSRNGTSRDARGWTNCWLGRLLDPVRKTESWWRWNLEKTFLSSLSSILHRRWIIGLWRILQFLKVLFLDPVEWQPGPQENWGGLWWVEGAGKSHQIDARDQSLYERLEGWIPWKVPSPLLTQNLKQVSLKNCGYFISDEFEKQRRPSLERMWSTWPTWPTAPRSSIPGLPSKNHIVEISSTWSSGQRRGWRLVWRMLEASKKERRRLTR